MRTSKKQWISQNGSIVLERYSKHVIFAFTMLFSTFFGAILLVFNLKRLKKPQAGLWVFVFGVFYTIFSIGVLQVLGNSTSLTILVNLGGVLFLTTFLLNRSIGKQFVYKSKNFIKLAAVALLVLVFVIFLFLYGHLILWQLYHFTQ